MKRIVLILSLTQAACATTALRAELRSLREQVATGEHVRGELANRVEVLENRVVVLAGELERRKNEANRLAQLPSLPIVTLRPPSEADPDETGDAPAHDSSQPRPMIRLTGRAPRGTPAADVPHTDSALPNLGVVKPPSLAQATHTTATQAQTPAQDRSVQALYRQGREQLVAGRLDDAEVSFGEILQRFPSHELADNAQYWIGELHYQRNELPRAMAAFRDVLRRWPQGNKAADAQLKLAYCQLLDGDETAGRAGLMTVISRYPGTEAAHLAERRLAELGSEKNKEKP